MNKMILLYFMVIYISCFVQSQANVRVKRTGKIDDNPASIRPPSRLKSYESHYPPPGWTHCIRKVVATSQWRAISTYNGFRFQTTQFQCTWMISVEKNEALPLNKQIQISVQKLKLGKIKDQNCRQNFLEIIDYGKTQGRFCDNSKPGDYVTIGDHVRLDIQGEGELSNLVRAKGRNPFIISYRAVPKELPGFRTYVTKNIIYDKYHPSSIGFGEASDSGSPGGGKKGKKGRKDEDDTKSEDPFGPLGKTGVIGLAVLGGIVLIICILLIVRRCCCNFKKEKTNKDKPDSSSVEEGNVYPPPPPAYSKATLLPGQPYTPSGHSHNNLPNNEVILTSEIIRPPKQKKPLLQTSKTPSFKSGLKTSATTKPDKVKKTTKSKPSEGSKKANHDGNHRNKKTKVISTSNIRQKNKKKAIDPKKKALERTEKNKRKKKQDGLKENQKINSRKERQNGKNCEIKTKKPKLSSKKTEKETNLKDKKIKKSIRKKEENNLKVNVKQTETNRNGLPPHRSHKATMSESAKPSKHHSKPNQERKRSKSTSTKPNSKQKGSRRIKTGEKRDQCNKSSKLKAKSATAKATIGNSAKTAKNPTLRTGHTTKPRPRNVG